MFIKYNSPLPSSADVESLFGVAATSSGMSAINFERLVFLKGSMDLLGVKKEEGEE